MEAQITKEMVAEWLRNNNYWDAYQANLKSNNTTFDEVWKVCSQTTLTDLFEIAFDFEKTPQGEAYWLKATSLLNKWRKSFSPESHCELILRYLQSGHTITALEALDMFNCMRLGSRIGDLRRRGWGIKTESIRTRSGKIIARYSLNEEIR